MIKFLDLYKLDKRLSKKINSNINQTIKNGDFILGKKVHEFEKNLVFMLIQNILLAVLMAQMHFF